MSFVLTWAHRDRHQQADQSIDHLAGPIGQEPQTHYALRVYQGETLLAEKLDIAGATATVEPGVSGVIRCELWSIRDGLDSYQRYVFDHDYTAPSGATAGITAPTWTEPGPPVVIIDGGEIT